MVSRPRRWTLSRSAYVALHCTCWRRHCSTCKVGSEVCLVGEKSCQACSVVMVGGGWEAGGWAAYERCRCVSDSWGVRLRWRKDGPRASILARPEEYSNRGILLSADALPTPTTDASEVAPDKRDFAKRRRAAGHRRHRHGDPPPLGLSRLTCPLRWARPAVTAKMRHHQRLQGHALRRCSAGVERDCRISVLWTPPATQTCTVVHV